MESPGETPPLFAVHLELESSWLPNTSSLPHKIRERLRTKYFAKKIAFVRRDPSAHVVEASFSKLWMAVDLWRNWNGDDVLALNGVVSVTLCDPQLLTPDPVPSDCFEDSSDIDDEDVPRDTMESVTSEAETSYFASYDRCSIHKAMIEDGMRTMAYKRAIGINAHLFRGKVVLEVGSGTGILSFFAAQAGARRVYAIEASSLSLLSRKAVNDNGFEDIITVCSGKVEDVDLPEKADILISEWMGYGLLFENMLASVLYARDKWLKPGGLIFPDKARLFITGYCGLEERTLEIYSRTEVDLLPLQDYVKRHPKNRYVERHTVIGLSHLDHDGPEDDESKMGALCLHEWDLKTCESSSCGTVNCQVELAGPGVFTGLVVYFEVAFAEGPREIRLTTSPFSPPTHWAQLVLKLKALLVLYEMDSATCDLRVSSRPLRPRAMEIRVRLRPAPNNQNQQQEAIEQKFIMGR